MPDISSVLKELKFNKTFYVKGRSSIADLFRPRKRCGIYILHFIDNSFYVGQAVDVTKRFVQHKSNHIDIEKISFKEVSKGKLDDAERVIIGMLEKAGLQLRNISLASIPRGQSDFNLIMPVKQQNLWLKNLNFYDLYGSRPEDDSLRYRYRGKFERFQKMKWADDALKVLKEYVKFSIPAIKRGEISFWSCSCLPSFHDKGVKIYSRINIYWQEVFTVYKVDSELQFSWHLALSPLEDLFGRSLEGLRQRYRQLKIYDHKYQTGGDDQINIVIGGTDQALDIVHDRQILKAVRLFNLRLMRKGACMYNRYHCLDLADKII